MNHELANVFLVRHSEARKTVSDIHGGDGTPLTTKGRIESSLLAEELKEATRDLRDVRVFSGPRPQTLETAEIIAEKLGRANLVVDEMINMHMGVLDGLSTLEAKRNFPEASNRLDDWRAGRLRIDELNIPDSEEFPVFCNRVLAGLKKAAASSENPIIVVTRSVGIAIVNTLLSGMKADARSYRRYRFDPGSITRLQHGASGYEFVLSNYTGYLQSDVRRPDD